MMRIRKEQDNRRGGYMCARTRGSKSNLFQAPTSSHLTLLPIFPQRALSPNYLPSQISPPRKPLRPQILTQPLMGKYLEDQT